jgi:hypothetical protein
MNPASDPYDGGIGGPGIWDQMPLVPPTTTPQEVDDSELIWSKPRTTKTRKTTKKKTKKTAGRSKKRR